MKVSEIAYFIGMKPEELSKIIRLHPENPLSIAYHRGQLKTVVMLRFDVRRYAVSGSPDANKEMLQHFSEQKYSENAWRLFGFIAETLVRRIWRLWKAPQIFKDSDNSGARLLCHADCWPMDRHQECKG